MFCCSLQLRWPRSGCSWLTRRQRGLDAEIIAFVHDEIQIQVKGDADYVGNHIAKQSAREAEYFKIKKSQSKPTIQQVRRGEIPIDEEWRPLFAMYLTAAARVEPYSTKAGSLGSQQTR